VAKCPTCSNEVAYRLSYRTGKDGIIRVLCDKCGLLNPVVQPDVYFKGAYYDESIVDEKNPATWDKGTYVESRAHKAALMKKHNLFESGDRKHGSRNFDKRRIYI
jgi:hypothetical protein